MKSLRPLILKAALKDIPQLSGIILLSGTAGIGAFKMPREFNLGNGIIVKCDYKKTRSGFKHIAELYKDNILLTECKICYLNRTWESYNFQSVLLKAIEKTAEFSKAEKEKYRQMALSPEFSKADLSEFKLIANIARMGEVLTEPQKEKNDWKVRMLKAGLENKGLIMPEDWEILSEAEKEKRLNKAIAELDNL
jgi:hypothetical protein